MRKEHRTQSTEHRTQSTEHRTQSTEHRAQNTEQSTQSTEHRTQSTEHRAQNTEQSTQSTEHRAQSREQRAESIKLRVKSIRINIFILFLLVTFYSLLVTAVAAMEIKSRSAVVMDAVTGRVLYAKNPNLRLMPASTTKLMTALVVVEKVKLSDVVTISKRATGVAPTKAGLKKGDKVTVETLLYAALMKSANDAAVVLAEAVAGSEQRFVRLMNRKAIAIGANNTRFINSNGLPGKGQYTTAYDLSKIMRQAIRHPVLKEILGTRIARVTTETGKKIFIKNTNKLLWTDEDLLGGKTGYTRQAMHCFVSAGERDNNIITVALLGTPSRDLLWKETEDLMAFGFRVMKNLEEPVVYLNISDYDALNVTRASYTKKTKYRPKNKRLKKQKIEKRLISSKNKSVKTKQIVKKKKGSKSKVKSKKGLKQNDAKN